MMVRWIQILLLAILMVGCGEVNANPFARSADGGADDGGAGDSGAGGATGTGGSAGTGGSPGTGGVGGEDDDDDDDDDGLGDSD